MNRIPPSWKTRISEPPFVMSLGICVSLTLLMSWLRLDLFHDRIFPVAVGLPLLLCIWNRDLRLLYGMAGALTIVSLVKVFGVMPAGSHLHSYSHVILGSQLADIWLLAVVIHGLLRARRKIELRNVMLDKLNAELEAGNEELAASNEELAAREEEITRQNEELQSQAEELEQQAEDLRQQTEETELTSAELHEINQELIRKDRGLQTLLDSGRWLRSDMNEIFVMNGICQAAVQVFGDSVQAGAVASKLDELLHLKGNFGFGLRGTHCPDIRFKDSFTSRVLESGRTACIENVIESPGVKLPPPVTGPPFRSVIGAPIWLAGEAIGTLEVFSTGPRQWTEDDFRIIEWLAAQVAVALQAIFAQQEVEQKRRDAEEASRQKTRFLAAVSHDVRTPAHAISLLAEFIERSAGDPEGIQRIPALAKDLWSNARSMVDLVSSVLDITRFDSGSVELDRIDFPLCELVRSVVRQSHPHAENKGLKLTCDVPPEEIWISSDWMKLSRVMSNLVSNAIKFTEAGEVKMEILPSGDGGLCIHVIDTGIGIPGEHLDRVFDEFFQLRNPERDREKGAGLGLAICHRLTKALGFGLRVRSLLGVGSTFTIEIPCSCVVRAADSNDAHGEDWNPFDGLPVLLVEDHEIARDVTAGLLTAQGARVCKAANGRDAVKLLSTGKHQLLLLDLNLPDFDGTEILRTIQQQRPEELRWVLVVSGDVRPERVEEVKRLGACTLIPKPVCIDDIRAALREHHSFMSAAS